MEIFNIIIWGNDAEKFCALTRDEKIQWILKHTNQKDLNQIELFLESPIVKAKECLSCGTLNNKIENPFKYDSNISKANAIEVTASSYEVVVGEPSNTNSVKRPRQTKRGKN
jgi:hypothetical protein